MSTELKRLISDQSLTRTGILSQVDARKWPSSHGNKSSVIEAGISTAVHAIVHLFFPLSCNIARLLVLEQQTRTRQVVNAARLQLIQFFCLHHTLTITKTKKQNFDFPHQKKIYSYFLGGLVYLIF